jgi:hypothetical protein
MHKLRLEVVAGRSWNLVVAGHRVRVKRLSAFAEYATFRTQVGTAGGGGQWYYEARLGAVLPERAVFGFATAAFKVYTGENRGVGECAASWGWGFEDGAAPRGWGRMRGEGGEDGTGGVPASRMLAHHAGERRYHRGPRVLAPGDTVGCLLDRAAGVIAFFVNGEAAGARAGRAVISHRHFLHVPMGIRYTKEHGVRKSESAAPSEGVPWPAGGVPAGAELFPAVSLSAGSAVALQFSAAELQHAAGAQAWAAAEALRRSQASRGRRGHLHGPCVIISPVIRHTEQSGRHENDCAPRDHMYRRLPAARRRP